MYNRGCPRPHCRGVLMPIQDVESDDIELQCSLCGRTSPSSVTPQAKRGVSSPEVETTPLYQAREFVERAARIERMAKRKEEIAAAINGLGAPVEEAVGSTAELVAWYIVASTRPVKQIDEAAAYSDYYHRNAEAILARQKIYAAENKDTINAKRRERNKKRREAIRGQYKRHYDKNREKIIARVAACKRKKRAELAVRSEEEKTMTTETPAIQDCRILRQEHQIPITEALSAFVCRHCGLPAKKDNILSLKAHERSCPKNANRYAMPSFKAKGSPQKAAKTPQDPGGKVAPVIKEPRVIKTKDAPAPEPAARIPVLPDFSADWPESVQVIWMSAVAQLHGATMRGAL